MNDLRSLLAESSVAERKSFIKSFVKEVVVKDDKTELKYTIPLSNEGLLEESMGVPHIVCFGGPWWTVPELVFERKRLIPALQQLLAVK